MPKKPLHIEKHDENSVAITLTLNHSQLEAMRRALSHTFGAMTMEDQEYFSEVWVAIDTYQRTSI